MFTTGEALLEQVGALPGVEETLAPDGTPPPRYNIAPTSPVALVRIDGREARVDAARWALLPHWKKDEKGPPLFNARAETVREKPSFRDAFTHGRAVMPLDGYYEWHTTEGGKVPYFVTPPAGEMLWAAALWSTGLGQLSATMITTESAEPVEWLHHRLPRFLRQDEIRQWCGGSPDEAAELLRPAPASLRESLSWRRADKAVGNTRNDYPELIGDPAPIH